MPPPETDGELVWVTLTSPPAVRVTEALGGEAISIVADVSKSADTERMVKETVEKFGRLDCAFNNAGTLGNMRPLADLTEDDFDDDDGLRHLNRTRRQLGAAIDERVGLMCRILIDTHGHAVGEHPTPDLGFGDCGAECLGDRQLDHGPGLRCEAVRSEPPRLRVARINTQAPGIANRANQAIAFGMWLLE